MAKEESSEEFRARRLADAQRVAALLFDLQKPTVRTDAKAIFVSKCPARFHRKSSLDRLAGAGTVYMRASSSMYRSFWVPSRNRSSAKPTLRASSKPCAH